MYLFQVSFSQTPRLGESEIVIANKHRFFFSLFILEVTSQPFYFEKILNLQNSWKTNMNILHICFLSHSFFA